MQTRSKQSTAPHFVRGDQAIVVTKNLFLRGQPNRKLRDRQLRPFTIEEYIGKRSYYKFELTATVRLHKVFHINNLRPSFTTFLRHVVHVTTREGDDDEFEVSHISAMCASSRYLDDKASICSSWRTLEMTTFHTYGIV
jgi:hypothetical protein